MSEIVAIFQGGEWRRFPAWAARTLNTLEDLREDYLDQYHVTGAADLHYRMWRAGIIELIPDVELAVLVDTVPGCELEYPRPEEPPEPEPRPPLLDFIEHIHSPDPINCAVGCVLMWFQALCHRYADNLLLRDAAPDSGLYRAITPERIAIYIATHESNGRMWAGSGMTLRGIASMAKQESGQSIYIRNHYSVASNNPVNIETTIHAGLAAGEPVFCWAQPSNMQSNHVYLVTGYEEIPISGYERPFTRFRIMDPWDPDVHWMQGYRPEDEIPDPSRGILVTRKYAHWHETTSLALPTLELLEARIDALEMRECCLENIEA